MRLLSAVIRQGTSQLLKNGSGRFGEDGNYILAVGRQYSLLCEIEEAKKFVKRAIKADSSLKADFLDDPAFDSVWALSLTINFLLIKN
jgi:hypothetical protein